MQNLNGSINTNGSEDHDFGIEFLEKIADYIVGNFNPEELFGEDDLFEFVKSRYTPEQVCVKEELAEWAKANGYVKAD